MFLSLLIKIFKMIPETITILIEDYSIVEDEKN
jgi:hypothetical protein